MHSRFFFTTIKSGKTFNTVGGKLLSRYHLSRLFVRFLLFLDEDFRKTLIFVMCLRIRNITRLSLPSAFKKYGMALCSNIITDIMEHQVSALFSNERCQFSNLAITTLLIIEK